MDEPTSALDPISTKVIEKLMVDLSDDFSIVVVTHNMQQARRIAHYTSFFHLGELVEFGNTNQIFEDPKEKNQTICTWKIWINNTRLCFNKALIKLKKLRKQHLLYKSTEE